MSLPTDRLGIDDSVVISLATRYDRRIAFWRQFPADWPLPRPRYVRAVDGAHLTAPAHWRSGAASYGCALSHLSVLQDAMYHRRQAVLVFEDDALFTDDATDALQRFAEDVPDDWQLLLLGGQHMRPPRRVTQNVVRCRRASRTHAYIIRGPSIPALHELWSRARTDIDRGWGDLQREVPTYAAWPFIVGQAAGHSDIVGLHMPERFWR